MSPHHLITHHPGEDLLLAYAGGAADETVGLIVATHLSYCATCRQQCRRMESLGGSLLADLPPAPMSGGALDAALARLDDITPYERAARPVSRDGTPAVLRSYVGGDLRDVSWRRVNSDLSYVPLFHRGSVAVRLLRGAPGARTGAHRHTGQEYSLVLRGGFRDQTGAYGPGDLQVMEGDMRHNPVADLGEDCINLSVTTGPLKFENFLQRIVAPLFGF